MLTVLRTLHLLSAAVWVGGTVALVYVGVPAIRRLEGEARATAMRARRPRSDNGRRLSITKAACSLVSSSVLPAVSTPGTREDIRYQEGGPLWIRM